MVASVSYSDLSSFNRPISIPIGADLSQPIADLSACAIPRMNFDKVQTKIICKVCKFEPIPTSHRTYSVIKPHSIIPISYRHLPKNLPVILSFCNYNLKSSPDKTYGVMTQYNIIPISYRHPTNKKFACNHEICNYEPYPNHSRHMTYKPHNEIPISYRHIGILQKIPCNL
jgi:hypothetical protein